MPILFSTMTGGRVMASLYFLMVVVAGFSTYVTIINSTTQVLVDWGGTFLLFSKDFHFREKSKESL